MANKLTSGLGFIYDPHLTMTAKSKNQKKTTKKDHYTAILLEEVKDQFKFVVEKMEGMDGSLRGEMCRIETGLKQDIADTQQALKLTREVLQKQMTQDKAELQGQMAQDKAELREQMVQDKAELKQEIQELSKKADRTHEIVLRHDREIASLKKSA